MRTEPRFVKANDYKNYTGKDLSAMIGTEDSNNLAEKFILRVEDLLLTRIDNISFRVQDWDNLTGFQLECLQKAIIEQITYIVRNSDLFTDSGYDLDKGKIIDSNELYKIEICRASKDYLRSCGLLNLTVKNKFRYNSFFE